MLCIFFVNSWRFRFAELLLDIDDVRLEEALLTPACDL
jgi:hypothetical protein